MVGYKLITRTISPIRTNKRQREESCFKEMQECGMVCCREMWVKVHLNEWQMVEDTLGKCVG